MGCPERGDTTGPGFAAPRTIGPVYSLAPTCSSSPNGAQPLSFKLSLSSRRCSSNAPGGLGWRARARTAASSLPRSLLSVGHEHPCAPSGSATNQYSVLDVVSFVP
jgi:hypothetical protein